MNIKGTKSEENVKAALAGESIARNKYTFFSLQAAAEGYSDIAEFFEKMAKNETTHAKIWFNLLYSKNGTTMDNLENAASGENDEWSDMYPHFAEIARSEGLMDLAQMFEKVGEIEQDHEKQFLKTLIKLKTKTDSPHVEEIHKKMGMRCQFCGATFEQRPDVCSVCGAIGAFEICEI